MSQSLCVSVVILPLPPAGAQRRPHMRRRLGGRGDRVFPGIERQAYGAAVQVERRGGRASRSRAARAIDRVAQHRTADFGAMHADLVGAAGLRAQFQPGQPAGPAQRAVGGDGRLARRLVRHHAPAALLRGDLGQRQVDPPRGPGRRALDHGPVGLLDPAVREQPRQPPAAISGCAPAPGSRWCPGPAGGPAPAARPARTAARRTAPPRSAPPPGPPCTAMPAGLSIISTAPSR